MKLRRLATRGESAGFASATMWLVFLLIPVIGVAVSDVPLWLRLLAWGGLALFGVVYALSFLRAKLVRSWPIGVNRVLWAVLATAPALLAVPSIGWNVVAIAPFVIAMLAFYLDVGPAIVTGAAIYAAVIVSATVSSTLHRANFWGLFIGVTVGTVFVVIMRVVTAWDEANAAARTELARVRERSDVARDVHDILGHSLTVISVKTELAQRLVRTDPDAAERELADVQDLARSALAEVRSTVTELRAGDFATQLEASRQALRAAGVAVLTDGDPAEPPRGPLFVSALRELTTNAVRHAGATQVRIAWDASSLRVRDDGVGMRQAKHGNGLTGLVERATAVGAEVTAAPGAGSTERPGTVVEVRLP